MIAWLCRGIIKCVFYEEARIMKLIDGDKLRKHLDYLIEKDNQFAKVQPINSLVKVEERVPDVSGNYLCYLANGEFDVLYFDRGIEDDMYNNDYPFGVWNTYPSNDGGECREWIEVLEVTHWMLLPETPKE